MVYGSWSQTEENSVPCERQRALTADWLLRDTLCEVKGHDSCGLGQSTARVLPERVGLRLTGLTEIQRSLKGQIWEVIFKRIIKKKKVFWKHWKVKTDAIQAPLTSAKHHRCSNHEITAEYNHQSRLSLPSVHCIMLVSPSVSSYVLGTLFVWIVLLFQTNLPIISNPYFEVSWCGYFSHPPSELKFTNKTKIKEGVHLLSWFVFYGFCFSD